MYNHESILIGKKPFAEFFKIGVLKNYTIFTGKHLCWSLFLIKKPTPTQVFSSEYCKIFKNTYFGENLRKTAPSRFHKYIQR